MQWRLFITVLLLFSCLFPTSTHAQFFVQEIVDSTGDGGGNTLSNPPGIAADANGNVFVTGLVSDNAFKIAPDGMVSELIDATGDGEGNPLSQPVGIIADTSGNVYVAEQASDNALRITSGGAVTQILDAAGDRAGNVLDNPFGLVATPDDIVYVTGFFRSNAFEISPLAPRPGSRAGLALFVAILLGMLVWRLAATKRMCG